MSKHDQHLAECEGKDPLTADVAKKLAKRQRKKGVKVEAFKCSSCNKWHIGRPKKPLLVEARNKIRPTPERQTKGVFVNIGGKAAVERHVKDVIAHPIDALEYSGIISHEQAEAGRKFEEYYRAASETAGTRDSLMTWEPSGHDSGDGPVEEKARYRALCRHLEMRHEARLQYVCVYQNTPKGSNEEGLLREALNEAARFFNHGRR